MLDKTLHDADVSFSPVMIHCTRKTTFFIFRKLTLRFKLTFHWDVKNSTWGNLAFSFSRELWLTLGKGLGLSHLEMANIFFNVYFIYFKGDSVSREEAEREGEREKTPRRLCMISMEPDEGLNPTHREIMI